MVDTEQYYDSPAFACQAKYDCGFQGIQAGWVDVYGPSLDCNWIDITDVPDGNYILSVHINPNRIFAEETFTNNISEVEITIGTPTNSPSPVVPLSPASSLDTQSLPTQSNNDSSSACLPLSLSFAIYFFLLLII